MDSSDAGRDYFNEMPDIIQLEVLKKMRLGDIARLSRTCSTAHENICWFRQNSLRVNVRNALFYEVRPSAYRGMVPNNLVVVRVDLPLPRMLCNIHFDLLEIKWLLFTEDLCVELARQLEERRVSCKRLAVFSCSFDCSPEAFRTLVSALNSEEFIIRFTLPHVEQRDLKPYLPVRQLKCLTSSNPCTLEDADLLGSSLEVLDLEKPSQISNQGVNQLLKAWARGQRKLRCLHLFSEVVWNSDEVLFSLRAEPVVAWDSRHNLQNTKGEKVQLRIHNRELTITRI